MIKKLDKLIIRSFVGPFIATFLISNFVLVMQVFWLWIDDLVGKGLDFFCRNKADRFYYSDHRATGAAAVAVAVLDYDFWQAGGVL